MAIVFQSSLVQKKTSNPLRLPALDLGTNPVVTVLSPISSPLKVHSNPASPGETPASQLQSTNNPTNTIPHCSIAPSVSTGLQYSIAIPENDQSEKTQELPPFNSLLSDVRPIFSRPNHLKFQPDYSILGRQHRPEYHTNRAGKTRRPHFNQHLQYSLKPEFSTWEIAFWDSRRQEATIQSTSLPPQRLAVPPKAITALSRCCRSTLLHQPSSLIINFSLTRQSHCATQLR